MAIAMVSFPAIWPFLNFLNINRGENFSVLKLGMYGFGMLLVVCIGFLIFRMAFSKILGWRRSGAIFAVGVISFFCYSMIQSLAYELWQGHYLKSWAVFAVIMLLLAWFLSRSPLFQTLVFVLGAMLAVVPTVQYLGYQTLLLMADDDYASGRFKAISIEKTESLPSVYHIVLDEYSRADVLQAIYGFDNRDYLEKLTERGFYVADKAMSNYKQTSWSIPSVLAMDYMFQVETSPQVMAQASKLLNGGGPVFEWFQNAGYYTALLRYGGADCTPGSPDFCYSFNSVMYGELESKLIALTPLNSLTNLLIRMNVRLEPDYYHLWDVRDFIAGLRTEKPVFAHIHMLIPHSPYRFDRRCEPISPSQQQKNKQQGDLQNYIEHLKCANIESMKLVDAILLRNPNTIIILQADHGPRNGVSWSDWRTDDKWEQSFSILNAWRIPPGMDCRNQLHPELTSVNTFRLVQGCVSGTQPDLLPERWFDDDKTNNRFVEIFRN